MDSYLGHLRLRSKMVCILTKIKPSKLLNVEKIPLLGKKNHLIIVFAIRLDLEFDLGPWSLTSSRQEYYILSGPHAGLFSVKIQNKFLAIKTLFSLTFRGL